MTFYALLLIAIATAAPATPQPTVTITGHAMVIDGDTIDVYVDKHFVRVRLFGIDAPELAQRCGDADGLPYNCGMLSADALDEEIGIKPVSCFIIDTDQYRRSVAICMVDGRDLGERMVSRGQALDYPFFSAGKYAAAEKDAKEGKRGVWAGTFQNPREWRKEHRR